MTENRLVVHHVGGRGGERSFPLLPAFEKDIINVLYDADSSCLPEAAEYWKSRPSETIVLPYCVSAGDGVCTFHLNYDPPSSSIYQLNPKYAQFYKPTPSRKYDHVLGDSNRTMEEVQLATNSLDDVVLDRGEVPGPDFLSLDTQGSELNILTGASRLLSTTVLAVQAEVMFHPLYEGQPLFGDTCALLSKHNFDLVDVRFFGKWFPKRGKQGFRGKGYAADGEAIFLKRPETVDPGENGVRLKKLAFLATVFSQFELAQQCFETPGFDIMPQLPNGANDRQPRYLEFITRLAGIVASAPQIAAPLFSDVFPYTGTSAGLIEILPPRTTLQNLLLRLKWFKNSAMLHAAWEFKRSGSKIEALFLEFGMKEQYLVSRTNRIVDSWIQPNLSPTSPNDSL